MAALALTELNRSCSLPQCKQPTRAVEQLFGWQLRSCQRWCFTEVEDTLDLGAQSCRTACGDPTVQTKGL